MKKFLLLSIVFIASLTTFAKIPIAKDADQIITMNEEVYIKGRVPVVIMEIEPLSDYAKSYWGQVMPKASGYPALIAVSYAYSPDWTEYTILSMFFYNLEGQLIDKIEFDDVEMKPIGTNPRARDMAAIAKGLPQKRIQ